MVYKLSVHNKVFLEITFQFFRSLSPSVRIGFLAQAICNLCCRLQLAEPQSLYVNRSVAAWRTRIFSLTFCVHPCVGIRMRKIATIVNIQIQRCVGCHFHIIIYRLQECNVSCILQIIKHLHNKTRRAVGCIIQNALQIQSVGYTTISR